MVELVLSQNNFTKCGDIYTSGETMTCLLTTCEYFVVLTTGEASSLALTRLTLSRLKFMSRDIPVSILLVVLSTELAVWVLTQWYWQGILTTPS